MNLKKVLTMATISAAIVNPQHAPSQNLPKSIALCAVGGILQGGREAFHADPKVFDRLGAKEYGFFGSQQWQRKYEGNRYLNETGSVNRMKSQILGNFGRDYWHTSKYAVPVLYCSGVFLIADDKTKFKKKVLNLLVCGAVSSVCANLTYKGLRAVK